MLKLHKDIFLSHTLIEELDPEIDKPGIVMTNLPTLVDDENASEKVNLYQTIGENLKRKFSGFQLWVLSTDLSALKQIDLKTIKKLILYDDPSEFHFVKFELTEDSVREDEVAGIN